jgi:hypothetical protein
MMYEWYGNTEATRQGDVHPYGGPPHPPHIERPNLGIHSLYTPSNVPRIYLKMVRVGKLDPRELDCFSRFLSESKPESLMLKSELLAAIQREIQSHDFSHFVDEPPSLSDGGKGVVVPGCPRCRVRFHTTSQFLDHLANAMPALLEKLAQSQDIAK